MLNDPRIGGDWSAKRRLRRYSASWAAVCGAVFAALVGLVLMLLSPPPVAAAPEAARAPVIVLQVDGAIGPATTEYLRSGLALAKDRNAPLVVLVMDTPGGLDSSTRDIIGDILASPTPVATFVAPAGARAASAGTYILFASHLAAMAPGTHMGAATPVTMGGPGSPLPGGQPDEKSKERPAGQPVDAMSAKMTNDAAAYIASLAALQGRNAEWAERAVREAATLTSDQAKALRVVELIAADTRDLLAQADGRIVKVAGQPHRLATAGRPIHALNPGWRVQVLGVITNPNVAYLLLLVGIYGLMFEFMSPGMVAPGIIGAISLVTALFALNLLPVNYAGLLLLLIGLGLMTAEALNPTVGAFGIGGVVAFGLGSLMIFKGPIPEYRLSSGVVLVAAALSLAYFALALRSALRARHGALAIGPDTLIRAPGRVVSWSGGSGLVRVQGEDWQARAETPLAPGRGVRVVRRDGLALFVEPEEGPDRLPDAAPGP